ncbi:MAG TPA: ferritin-like domain-containing protein [Micropepsaceae bacterium]|nr:ferritin-like domain-containing protein [Micropepsaceae bacterium]
MSRETGPGGYVSDKDALIAALQKRAKDRGDRREFLRKSAGFAVGIVGGAAITACGRNTSAQTSGGSGSGTPPGSGPTDAEIFNFALNLEYLEAEFYSFASTGSGLAASMLTGTGTQGAATGGRQVSFSDPVVSQFASELAKDEMEHVNFLRTTLGSAAVAQPAIDIGTSPSGAFSSAARAAGLIGAGASFDPYASDANFLLAAFIFEDVGVTAYKGASPLIMNKTYLEAAAGILAVEAYHAGSIRTMLYSKGVAAPMLRTGADMISAARNMLDTPGKDQGIDGTANTSNIVPADSNGIAFSRSPAEVLNIVYLTPSPTNKGGFFPNGVNGDLVMSDH